LRRSAAVREYITRMVAGMNGKSGREIQGGKSREGNQGGKSREGNQGGKSGDMIRIHRNFSSSGGWPMVHV
jgi:hypothetical protein